MRHRSLRRLKMPKPQGRKRPRGNFQNDRKLNEPTTRKDDVYEAEDSDPEEDKNIGDRYDVSARTH